jgi:Uma2 family endonuclease
MASVTLIPLSEYLNTTYRPDCDYIDGKVKERNVGEIAHSFTQTILAAIFNSNRKLWQAVAGTELRIRVSAERVRIPDVCVKRRSDPSDPVLTVPPLVCIEVLSPGDTLESTQDRCMDYFRMGVPHVWIVDPIRRLGFVALPDGPARESVQGFAVPGTPIRISLTEVFAELDDMLAQD